MMLTIDTRPQIVLSGWDIAEVAGWISAAGGESPTLTVALDPARVDAAVLLQPPPLRAQATLVDDSGRSFAGLVQSVRLGADPRLTLEL